MRRHIFKLRKFNGDVKAFKAKAFYSGLKDGLPTKRSPYFFGELSKSMGLEELMTVKVVDIEPFCEDVKKYTLEPISGKLPNFEAGQSIGVYIKWGSGRYLKPFPLSSAPSEKRYSIIVFRQDFPSVRILEDWVVGTEISVTSPHGNFSYHPLRDEYEVLAFADKSGIAPFISMAHSIVERIEDFSLTVIYTVDYYKDIVFKSYLDFLQDNSGGKVKFVYLLAEESHIGCRHGLVTSSLIKSIKAQPYSVFAAGSEKTINRLEEHLKKLEIDKKHYHKRIPFVYYEPEFDERTPYKKPMTYYLTVRVGSFIYPPIPVKSGDTLMTTLQKAGVNIRGKCMTGECDFCRSLLIDGEVELFNDEKRTLIDVKYSYVHPCLCYPRSDVTLEIPIKKDEI